MSVLAGAVDWSPGGRARDDVAAMLGSLGSSCPDGVVLRSAPKATLGIGRLATTAQQARQDRTVPGPQVLAVVDGRFDDLNTLRDAVDGAPDASDADLIVAGYKRWGSDLVPRLRGEFALLIWDEVASTLIAARDPFGVRPLYYARPGGRFVVASDPEQLLAAGLVAAQADDETVVGHLLWEYQDAERTFFHEIRRLPAGHLLIANPSVTRIEDYRRPEIVDVGDGEQIWEEFRRRFFTAVRRRMESAGSRVLHLSGGLDSSCIVCAADRIRAAEPELYSGTVAAAALHPGMPSNEEKFIRAVEAEVKLPVECWDGTDARPDELDDPPVWAPGARFPWMGGTRGDLDIAARSAARVILNGSGGDQIGIGNGVLHDTLAEGRWGTAARYLIQAPGATVASSVRGASRLAKSFAPSWARQLHDAWKWRRQPRPPWLMTEAWSEWRPRGRTFTPPTALHTAVQRSHWRELTSPRLVVSVEFAQQHAIRNGIEIRYPFMDWDLVMFVLSIPSRWWPPPWTFERLHRRALGDILPAAIVKRRSKANAADLFANRVRRQLATIREVINGGSWASSRYVDQGQARQALDAFQHAGDPTFWTTWSVWAIATLETWLRRLSGYTATPKREE